MGQIEDNRARPRKRKPEQVLEASSINGRKGKPIYQLSHTSKDYGTNGTETTPSFSEQIAILNGATVKARTHQEMTATP